MTVLVVTNEQDIGADHVVLELERRRVRVLRCNAERLTDWRVSLRPGKDWELRDPLGRTLTSGDTSGVWWRRPEAPAYDRDIARVERRTLVDQWQAFAVGLASVRGPVWVSAPSAIASAEDKAAQIAAAHRVGFAVPNTVWTNDIDEARTLATRRETVVKTVTAAHWESDDEAAFVFAHPLTVDALPGSDEAFAAAPAVLQDRVEPKRDVRVTVAGGTVLAAETSVNQLDWRFTPQATWQPHELPVKASERCRSLVAELHLKFGGIDLALDTQGTYWFLEINANGEWGWLQARGLPIASALADVLHPTDES